jgi:hypothetical protein
MTGKYCLHEQTARLRKSLLEIHVCVNEPTKLALVNAAKKTYSNLGSTLAAECGITPAEFTQYNPSTTL